MKLLPYTPLTGREVFTLRAFLPFMAAALASREPEARRAAHTRRLIVNTFGTGRLLVIDETATFKSGARLKFLREIGSDRRAA